MILGTFRERITNCANLREQNVDFQLFACSYYSNNKNSIIIENELSNIFLHLQNKKAQ